MKRFDVIVGRFEPQRTDDLVARSMEFIGKTMQFIVDTVIDEGQYKGQTSMIVMSVEDADMPPFAWVPSSDVAIMNVPNKEE